jgi:hypothetical protein
MQIQVGFTELLTILFIGLKLGNIISWSWFWVLSPLWIPIAITFTVLLVSMALVGLTNLMKR